MALLRPVGGRQRAADHGDVPMAPSRQRAMRANSSTTGFSRGQTLTAAVGDRLVDVVLAETVLYDPEGTRRDG